MNHNTIKIYNHENTHIAFSLVLIGLLAFASCSKENPTVTPATATAIVEYVLPDGSDRATMELTNTLGLRVMTVELEGNKGSMHLDLGRLAGGVYPYTVQCGNKTKAGKIVITK